MSGLWRVVLFCYNLLILAIAVAAMYLAVGKNELITAVQSFLGSSVNQIILGASAAVVIALTILIMISLFKGESKPTSVVVSNSLNGQVSITVAAIKTIITKAVRKVDGGKKLALRAMDLMVVIYPYDDQSGKSVPEMTQSVQAV